jgi:hypothetical protein
MVLRNADGPGTTQEDVDPGMTRDVERDLQVPARLRREIIAALAAHDDAPLWAPAPLMQSWSGARPATSSS